MKKVEMEMDQEKSTNQFLGLPEEVWEFIWEKLDNPNDILSLFQAYPELGRAFKAKKQQLLFPKVVNKVLPWLTQKEILNCRQVCKLWSQCIELTDAIPQVRGPLADVENQIWGPISWIGKLKCDEKSQEGNDNYIKWPKEISMELVPNWKIVIGVLKYGPYQKVVMMTTDDGADQGSLCEMMSNHHYGGLVRFGNNGGQVLLLIPRVGNGFYGVIPNDVDKFLEDVFQEGL